MRPNDPFETTVQKANEWIHDIERRLGFEDRRRAWGALRAVLHALRDRLSVEEAAAFGAQLPLLVRGIYYEGWRPEDKPLRLRKKQEFLDRVSDGLRDQDAVNVEETTNRVLAVLGDHLSFEEAMHVRKLLPKDIAELWPD